MKLTAENVRKVLTECMFSAIADTTLAVVARGITLHIWFCPKKLKDNHDNIVSMLSELPEVFMKEHGGGMSFLTACETAGGVHWGEHHSMDELFTLGIAAGLVTECLPRSMWQALPGGVPYYMVDLNK